MGLGVQSTALLAVEVGETISRLPKRMQPSLGCALVFKAMRAILSYSEARLPQLAECLAAMLHMLKRSLRREPNFFGAFRGTIYASEIALLELELLQLLMPSARAPIDVQEEQERRAPVSCLSARLFWEKHFSTAQAVPPTSWSPSASAATATWAAFEAAFCSEFGAQPSTSMELLRKRLQRGGSGGGSGGGAGDGDGDDSGDSDSHICVRTFDDFTRGGAAATAVGLFEHYQCLTDPSTVVYVLGSVDDTPGGAAAAAADDDALGADGGEGAPAEEARRWLPQLQTALLGLRVTAVSCGGQHAAVLDAAGDVFTWGRGGFGRLGHGDDMPLHAPRRVEALRGVAGGADAAMVSCGFAYTAALDRQGRLYTWGAGENGRLGTGDETSRFTPTAVQLLPLPEGEAPLAVAATATATAAAAGAAAAVAAAVAVAAAAGAVAARAMGGGGGTPCAERSARVFAGSVHTCLLSLTGRVYTCGKREYTGHCAAGQSGSGGGGGGGGGPDELRLRALPASAFGGARVVELSVGPGGYHTIALTSEGEVYTWGHNRVGQLGCGGDGDAAQRGAGGDGAAPPPSSAPQPHCGSLVPTPRRVPGMRAKAVVKVMAGWGHTACVTASGGVLVCGRNFRGQLGLGDPSTFPTNERGHPFQSTFRALDIPQRRRACAVSCGGEHTAVQLEDGGVLTFGAGAVGQLGHGREQNEFHPREVRELALSQRSVRQVVCGNNSTIVLAGAYQPASLADICCGSLARANGCTPPGTELLPKELLDRIAELEHHPQHEDRGYVQWPGTKNFIGS